MACGEDTKFKAEIAKELECPICFELFENPRSLRCLHSLCEKCVGPLVERVGKKHLVRCPTCRKVTEVRNGDVSFIPKNTNLQNIILKLFEEKKDSTVVMCEEHEKEFIMYCETCETLVCSLCVANSHRKHDLQDVEIIYKRNKDELEQCNKNLELVVPNLKKDLESVENNLTDLDENGEDVRREINHSIDNLMEVLEKRRKELLEKVSELQEKKKEIFEFHIDYLQEEIGEINEVLESSKRTVKSENPFLFLLSKERVKKELQELTDKKYDLEVKERTEMYFQNDTTKLEKMMNELKEFGNITTDHPGPAYGPQCEVFDLEEMVQSGTAVNKPQGYKRKLTVKTKDKDGVTLKNGGASVRGVLTNKTKDTVKEILAVDNSDGSYDIVIDVNPSGSYELIIVINNRKINNSPYYMDCWKLDPSKCSSEDFELFYENSGGRGVIIGKGGWCGSIVGDVVFFEGSHSWNVTVDQIEGSFVLGVCLVDDDIKDVWWSGKTWVWWFNKFYNVVSRICPENRTDLNDFSMIQSGDLLTLSLDCKRKTLKLRNNRTKQSDIITGVYQRVKPYFNLDTSSFILQ